MRTHPDFFCASADFICVVFSHLWGAVGSVLRLSLRFQISVKILKVLGEGGFSFVYLCQDEVSGVSLAFLPPLRLLVMISTIFFKREFALKKIRCPTGSEDVRQAMREVEAYRRFKCADSYIPHLPLAILIRISRHPNIIRILVSSGSPLHTELSC